jgi:hypothetical protein
MPRARMCNPQTEASILQACRSAKGAALKGYVVVFEGDDEYGYSAYSPDLPGVVAAADTRAETGQPVPEPADAAAVTILDPATA